MTDLTPTVNEIFTALVTYRAAPGASTDAFGTDRTQPQPDRKQVAHV
ncbi:hypothetical protein EDF62_1522 [Leucobacter luti]|uniref:Uncharacterized protein n=1 Tax=Leucobacter luti TaxID=340320 RepID=A0A4R6S118_9MICO|nr:hypothetical protein [Leucobacter luti]TDP92316.1 hypothetical protein EDF62_1522 [Leucobacter luti]